MNRDIYVFLGPSLPLSAAEKLLDATYLPPVSQGDVYRVARTRPWAIVIIDGYFERIPAVWHKEILWAMSRGVHVFGASSMGALRAAELSAFGMVGVGAIFAAYRDGALEEDDEVAVAHGPAATGYACTSEAMVNVRATLGAAGRDGVVPPSLLPLLGRSAKSLFYRDRSWPRILEEAARAGAPGDDLAQFERWLEGGRVDLKRADAVAVLSRVAELREGDCERKQVDFPFERTDVWEQVARRAGRRELVAAAQATDQIEPLLDELRLEGPGSVDRVLEEGYLRAFAEEVFDGAGTSLTDGLMERATVGFRRVRELVDRDAMQGWLRTQELSSEDFRGLIEDEARWRWARELFGPEARQRVPGVLRASGRWPELSERARDKQSVLRQSGLEDVSATDTGLSADELLAWHLKQCGETTVSSGLEGYAEAMGLHGSDELLRLLAREYCYRREIDRTN